MSYYKKINYKMIIFDFIYLLLLYTFSYTVSNTYA